jgi:hypothetical protein
MAYSIFTPLTQVDDITSILGTEVTTGMWSGDTGSLSTAFTSSRQFGISGEFYYDIYNLNPQTSDSAEIQFSVAYGHVSGGGSPTLLNKNDSTLPTQVTYAQYRNLLLGRNVSRFIFGQTASDDIYVINMQRSRLRQTIDPGNWQLTLSGSNGLRTFIDDSGLGTATTGNITSNVYQVRSGSLTTGLATSDTTVYGTVYPDFGLIILNPSPISSSVGFFGSNSTLGLRESTTRPFAPYTGSGALAYQYQHEGLVRSISSSMAAGSPFIARSAEQITSTNYFIRLRNTQYNYSNNPTYYTPSVAGTVRGAQTALEPFRIKPLTYVTTIGLYNDENELLAVAKLSRPIQKSTDKEALIRVRLDY